MSKSIMNPQGSNITVAGGKYNILFTLKIMNDIQDEFDEPVADTINRMLDNAKQKEGNELLCRFLPIAAKGKKELTKEVIENNVNTRNLIGILATILNEFNDTMPTDDEVDPDPNQVSAQD